MSELGGGDDGDQVPLDLMREAVEKVTEPPEFLRGLESQKPGSRCPKQDADVRELAGKRFVHVARLRGRWVSVAVWALP